MSAASPVVFGGGYRPFRGALSLKMRLYIAIYVNPKVYYTFSSTKLLVGEG